jgi:hypothetical protein
LVFWENPKEKQMRLITVNTIFKAVVFW